MYRRQCSRCLLWLQLTLHFFDKPLYYSVSLCSLKAASTLQVIYHKITYCTLTWKTKEAVFACFCGDTKLNEISCFRFFRMRTDKQTDRHGDGNGRMFITLLVVARKWKKALWSHQCPFTNFYSFHQRQLFSNEKRRNLLTWLIKVTTSIQRITSRPSAGIDPVLVWGFLSFSASIIPQLQLWYFRWLVSVELVDNPLLSMYNHMLFPVIQCYL